MLIEHMSKGYSFQTFGLKIGIARSALYKWVDKHKAFEDSKREAEAHCRFFWEKIGIGGATGALKNFNAASWIYNMKCRFSDDWSEKQIKSDENTVTVKLAYDPNK
jgi:hypothetical protein